MVTKEFIGTTTKWLIGIILPILLAGVAWSFTLERRVAVIETSQTEMSKSVSQIGEDIRYIRNLIIEEIRKK